MPHVKFKDPETYTKPQTVTIPLQPIADSELLKAVCLENKRILRTIPRNRRFPISVRSYYLGLAEFRRLYGDVYLHVVNQRGEAPIQPQK